MGESFVTSLAMESRYLSTFLSMEPTKSGSPAAEIEFMNQQRQQMSLSLQGPDINLPLSADSSTPPPSWSSDSSEVLDAGLGNHTNEAEVTIYHIPRAGSRKCAKRSDGIWGAWFFFRYYFKPMLSEKFKTKSTNRDGNGVSSFDKSDLKLDGFLVQHDMENMYMWVFKEKPDNGLGKMQLRNYMNGHSRAGESHFPFCADKGFIRSHRMQRKHYKGLSNPQCIHGIEVVKLPNLAGVPEGDRKKWVELTGRDFNFSIPPEASDFESWRNVPGGEFEVDRPPPLLRKHLPVLSGRLLNGSVLNLMNQDGDVMDLSPHSNKRRKKAFFPHDMDDDCCLPANYYTDRSQDIDIHPNHPSWINEFSGVMRHVFGPVTAAKSIYEDNKGYLIMVSLPFSDPNRVKVCWRNVLTHGIVKISCFSTARMPCIKRHDRIFSLTDHSPEHCPPGDFVREIPLATRIPEDARIEAYYDETGTVLEIMVPKRGSEPEEHEVYVSMRPPHLGTNDLMLT